MKRVFRVILHGFIFKASLLLLLFLVQEGILIYTNDLQVLTQARHHHEALKKHIAQLDHDLAILSQEQPGFTFLKDHQVLEPLNRLALVDTLKRQATHYGFDSFTIDIAPDTSLPKLRFKIRLTPVTLTFASKTDLEVWSFLDTLQDKVLGLVIMDKVVLERGEGLLLKAHVTFSLLHMKVTA